MKQWQAIQAVTERAKPCPEVKGIFIKGSLAKGQGDEWSDVDLYCLVDQAGLAGFLPQRLDLLKAYRPLIYTSESDFVGPQVVAVYEDGLHFDLYTVTPETFPLVGSFKALYDPIGLLAQWEGKTRDHSIPPEQAIASFKEFSFTLLEFHAAWMRQDLVWATRLASHLAGDLGLLLRYRHDPANAMLGSKRLESYLPPALRAEMRKAVASCHGDSLVQGVLALCRIMEDTARELADQEGWNLDWRLFFLQTATLREV